MKDSMGMCNELDWIALFIHSSLKANKYDKLMHKKHITQPYNASLENECMDVSMWLILEPFALVS